MMKWKHTGKEIAAKIFPPIRHLFTSWFGNDGSCYVPSKDLGHLRRHAASKKGTALLNESII